MSGTESKWSSVEDEIAKLLPQIPREDAGPHSLVKGIPQDQALLSDVPSKSYRLLRAALVVSGAAVVISIVSPYLAWLAAAVAR